MKVYLFHEDASYDPTRACVVVAENIENAKALLRKAASEYAARFASGRTPTEREIDIQIEEMAEPAVILDLDREGYGWSI